MIDALIETAKMMARVLCWPINDETDVTGMHEPGFALNRRILICTPGPESYFQEMRDFVTPGGIQFKMGYNEKHNRLIVVAL